MITDSHCHVTNEFYDNIDNILKNANINRIHRIISCADSIESCKEIYEISKKYDNYFYALGIHPEHQYTKYEDFEVIYRKCSSDDKLIAIGEIGLDYHYENVVKDKQVELFEKQLALAEKENLPVIVHSREATLDTINTLKKYNVKGVIHCFSGSLETAKEYLKMGFYIGVGGVITFKNSKIKEVIKEIPLDRLLLETDSPFLSPEPLRGHKNEPANVKYVAEFIADLKNISFDELSKITEENIKALFKI